MGAGMAGRRVTCIECGRSLWLESALFCSPACHLMHMGRARAARAARERLAAAEHRVRMRGRERRLQEHLPE